MTDKELNALRLQINAMNDCAEQVMSDLYTIVNKGTARSVGVSNMCVFCTRDSDTWIGTTCLEEHVIIARVCHMCREDFGLGIVTKCSKCGKATFDWAVKTDGNPEWVHSWGIQ